MKKLALVLALVTGALGAVEPAALLSSSPSPSVLPQPQSLPGFSVTCGNRSEYWVGIKFNGEGELYEPSTMFVRWPSGSSLGAATVTQGAGKTYVLQTGTSLGSYSLKITTTTTGMKTVRTDYWFTGDSLRGVWLKCPVVEDHYPRFNQVGVSDPPPPHS